MIALAETFLVLIGTLVTGAFLIVVTILVALAIFDCRKPLPRRKLDQ